MSQVESAEHVKRHG